MQRLLQNLRPPQSRLIAAIAEHGQLQVAASACSMTQPAASRMLNELERQLETPLFLRTPKGMSPTPAGSLLARHAKRITHDLAQLAEEFTHLQTGQGGSVRAGAVTGPALGQLVPAIQQIKKEASSVDVSVQVAPSTTLIQALERGDLDFALARLPDWSDSRDFVVEPAQDEIVRLMVHEGHPMLGQAAVSLNDLHGLPWIIQDRGAPIRHAMESAFHDEGLAAPADVITTSSLLVVIGLLAGSDAIAPMSKEVADLLIDDPVSARFQTLKLNRHITVAPYLIITSRGRELTTAANRLLEIIRQNIGQIGESTHKHLY